MYIQICSLVTLYQSEGAKFCQPAVCQSRFFARNRLAKMSIFEHLWSPKMTEKKLNYFHLQVFSLTKPKFEGWMRFKPVLFLFSVVYKNGNKFREYFTTNVYRHICPTRPARLGQTNQAKNRVNFLTQFQQFSSPFVSVCPCKHLILADMSPFVSYVTNRKRGRGERG